MPYPQAVLDRWADADRRSREAYDAEQGTGAWDRAQAELRAGPTMIALGRPWNRLGYWEYGRG
jgi:hypothetical protein